MPTYRITTTIPAADKPVIRERLVEAKNNTQAIGHVAKDTITCEQAKPADIARLSKAGVDIEQVTE